MVGRTGSRRDVVYFFFFQAEDGIRDWSVTGVQTCALPIWIFLEPELATSSRMFEFVYKMFGEGNAVIPKARMGAIAKQLSGSLKQIGRASCRERV